MAKYCMKCEDKGEVPLSEVLPNYQRPGVEAKYIKCPVCKGASLKQRLRDEASELETGIIPELSEIFYSRVVRNL